MYKLCLFYKILFYIIHEKFVFTILCFYSTICIYSIDNRLIDYNMENVYCLLKHLCDNQKLSFWKKHDHSIV